jgi:hypothetical protein
MGQQIGQIVGQVEIGKKHDKAKIFEEFQQTKSDDQHLKYFGEVDGAHVGITIPRGSWDILQSIISVVIKYVPGDIVEIGMGESTEILANIARDNNVILYSCDIQMGGMFKVFDQPLFDGHVCFTEGSEKFMDSFGGSPSIAFIDGEHLYETTKKEVEFFLPKMKTGGVMFLHDTMPILKNSIKRDSKGYNPGDIYKVRQELERMPEYDVFTWPYSALNQGLTMVMKHGDLRAEWRQNGRIK